MNAGDGEGSPPGGFTRLREFTTDALRHWELRRLFYNLLLTVIFLAHFFARWPGSLSRVSFDSVLGLFVLAVLANVAFSTVYLVDVFIQMSGYRDSRRHWRRAILLVGFAFAAVLTHFFAKGMLSSR